MRVRLDRVEPALHARQRGTQRLRLRTHGGEVVDVARRCLAREFEQFATTRAPPRRGRPNSASTPDSRYSIERMPRPTNVIAAHGAITFTRHTFARSAHSADSTS